MRGGSLCRRRVQRDDRRMLEEQELIGYRVALAHLDELLLHAQAVLVGDEIEVMQLADALDHEPNRTTSFCFSVVASRMIVGSVAVDRSCVIVFIAFRYSPRFTSLIALL
jgi:hypothetical protein